MTVNDLLGAWHSRCFKSWLNGAPRCFFCDSRENAVKPVFYQSKHFSAIATICSNCEGHTGHFYKELRDQDIFTLRLIEQ